MQDIEFLLPRRHLVQHDDIVWRRVMHAGQPEGARHHRLQPGPGDGIPGCEQRHLVTRGDQLLGQPGYHPLGSAIQGRRNAFHQGGDLCNSHVRNLRAGLMHNEISSIWVPILSQLRQIGLQAPSWPRLTWPKPRLVSGSYGKRFYRLSGSHGFSAARRGA